MVIKEQMKIKALIVCRKVFKIGAIDQILKYCNRNAKGTLTYYIM